MRFRRFYSSKSEIKLCLVVPLSEKMMRCRALILINLAKLNMAWPKLRKKCFSCIGIYFVWFRLVVFLPLFKWHITGFIFCSLLFLQGLYYTHPPLEHVQKMKTKFQDILYTLKLNMSRIVNLNEQPMRRLRYVWREI